MKDYIENTNRILADWNPIGVPAHIAIEEYRVYIPLILRSIENRGQLMNCLEDILVNKLALGYATESKE